MEVKEVKTSYGEYEVYQNCVPEDIEKVDVYSCMNNCLKCAKQCDVGYTYKRGVMK